MSDEKQNPQLEEKEPLTETELNEQRQVRIEKMQKMVEAGFKPFGHKFVWTHHAKEIEEQLDSLAESETEVS